MSTSRAQQFLTPGPFTFNVPATVSSVFVSLLGGGGGGCSTFDRISSGSGGGGSGEYVIRVPYPVTPGGTVAGVVGIAGVAGVYYQGNFGPFPLGNGGDTIFGNIRCNGGKHGVENPPLGGFGGGPAGGISRALDELLIIGKLGAIGYTGGSAGGIGNSDFSALVHNAGGCINYSPGLVTTVAGAGGAGANSQYGVGGAGATGIGASGSLPLASALGAGGGGGGGSIVDATIPGADGRPGAVVVYWIE